MIDFIGIGAQKCATTWLYAQLARHPQVRFPAGKEIHFWNAHHDKGTDWWLSQFPDAAGVKQGEITPAYGFLDRATIAEIRLTVPDARLFYAMRNPIERAWSAAKMAVLRAEMTPDEASRPMVRRPFQF